ncbi:hypothetical protein D1BOALGB6SA_10528 [Olavius sp. associated proteobacterium Delta 1]|nr:hypothetical protein D1BOALGB6SA_10528 [Olavius sp. associated proteobacterium Delta 1]
MVIKNLVIGICFELRNSDFGFSPQCPESEYILGIFLSR